MRSAILDRHREQRERAGHARDERHVGDRDPRDHAQERARADDEQGEPRDPPVDQAGEHPPHHDQAEHRREHERQPDRDQGARVVDQLAGVAAIAGQADRAHRRRHHPEHEDGLAAEAFILLRPVGVDPIVILQHDPADVAVVGLPRVGEGVAPDAGDEDGERDHDDAGELEAERALGGGREHRART
jgi:hypothetical protein